MIFLIVQQINIKIWFFFSVEGSILLIQYHAKCNICFQDKNYMVPLLPFLWSQSWSVTTLHVASLKTGYMYYITWHSIHVWDATCNSMSTWPHLAFSMSVACVTSFRTVPLLFPSLQNQRRDNWTVIKNVWDVDFKTVWC